MAANASVGGTGTIGGGIHFDDGAALEFSTTHTLSPGGTVTFGSFGIADLTGLDSSVADGTYTLISGNVDFTHVSNVGIENAADLGNGKYAYLRQGSLQVVVIPEPSAALLSLSCTVLAGLVRRRSA